MVDKKDCFYLGRITKPFSYKGELVLFLDVDDLSRYEDLEFVYLDIYNRLVRYDILSSRIHGSKLVVAFKDVSVQEANMLVGKQMYLPLDMLEPLSGNQFYFHEVIGFEVFDKDKGDLGHIQEIIDNNAQPIMSINSNGTEILIPLTDSIIKKVDRQNRSFFIQAPEGLIDIYLQ